MKVDIGIPVYGQQHDEWWGAVMLELLRFERSGAGKVGSIRHVGSAMPDHNKKIIVDDKGLANQKRRGEVTDMNRAAIGAGFRSGDADWLWMLDDDIVPPAGALPHLLSLGHPLVGGVCFLGKPPHNVTAYFRNPDGTYRAIFRFLPGAIMDVDAIGMGCTLIHRSVFDRIMETHTVYERPEGSVFAVPNRVIKDRQLPGDGAESRVEHGYYRMPVKPMSQTDPRPWPFFAMEYGRTEDLPFCEMAREAGFQPKLDTTVLCGHIKPREINRKTHLLALEAYLGDNGRETDPALQADYDR